MSKARIVTAEYGMHSDKVAAPVRLLVVSDLHNARYGEGQARLLAAVDAARPDAVLLTGDLFHKNGPEENTRQFLRLIGTRYPCYFVTGNHEQRTGHADALRAFAADCGITVLCGGAETFTAENGQSIQLLGVDWQRTYREASGELADAAALRDPALFSVILVHAPDHRVQVLSHGFDLMVSGHAHGGQWRIPGVLNGVFAPGQGLFPQYAGGLYDVAGGKLAVSRGLGKKPALIPRFFNPPEITLVTVSPALSPD